MVDLFGREIADSEERELVIPAGHVGCFGGCGVVLPEDYPFPIVIVGELYKLYICSDLCGLTAGYEAAVRTRQIGEENGFGWQVTTNPDGVLMSAPDELPDEFYALEESLETR